MPDIYCQENIRTSFVFSKLSCTYDNDFPWTKDIHIKEEKGRRRSNTILASNIFYMHARTCELFLHVNSSTNITKIYFLCIIQKIV